MCPTVWWMPLKNLRSRRTQNEGRHSWDSEFQFFIYALGYCTGFGNIWRFPYLIFKHGGIFMIPYLIFLVSLGIPIVYLELLLGQYLSRGPVFIYSQIAPICTGIGWCTVLMSFICSLYYNLIISWTLFYLYHIFKSMFTYTSLPWGTCHENSKFLNSTDCFVLKLSKECLNEGLAAWNNKCIPKSAHCKHQNLLTHNLTHCEDMFGTPIDFEQNLTYAAEAFYKYEIVGLDSENHTGEITELLVEQVVAYGVAWILVFICLKGGIRQTAKISYFTVALPYILLLYLLFANDSFTSPSLLFDQLSFSSKDLTTTTIWKDAATQVLFSLGVGFGCLPTVASYNSFKQNFVRDSFTLAFYNMATSILCMMLMYTTISAMTTGLNKDIDDIIKPDRILPFKIYASTVGDDQLLAVLFFLTIFFMGIDCQVVMVETVVSTIQDQFSTNKRTLLVFVVCLISWLLGIMLCTNGGLFIFEILMSMTGSVSLFIIAFFEVIAITVFYGIDKVLKNVEEMRLNMPFLLKKYFCLMWKIVTPITLIVVTGVALHDSVYCLKETLAEQISDDKKCTTQKTFKQALIVLILSGGSLFVVLLASIIVAIKYRDIRTIATTTNNCCPLIKREEKQFIKQNIIVLPDVSTASLPTQNHYTNYGFEQH